MDIFVVPLAKWGGPKWAMMPSVQFIVWGCSEDVVVDGAGAGDKVET